MNQVSGIGHRCPWRAMGETEGHTGARRRSRLQRNCEIILLKVCLFLFKKFLIKIWWRSKLMFVK